MEVLVVGNTAYAVSYTHLDVYKRQLWRYGACSLLDRGLVPALAVVSWSVPKLFFD